jgi:CrcB protein
MGWVMPYLLVGIGGFLGANARFLTARWVGGLVETRFPLGTFVINMGGSFLLGIIGALVAQKVFRNADAVRLALGVGFMGAFTTYSTFMFESHALLEDGEWFVATANVALSVFVGLVAVRVGSELTRAWLS